MISVDLVRTYRDDYTAAVEPSLVDVPERPYLMIDGAGDPNTSTAYQAALAALYPLAYAIRAVIKREVGIAYKVMPLEGLWWVEGNSRFSLDDRSNWKWTALICLPDQVTDDLASSLVPEVTAKKRLAAGGLARIEGFGDGLAVQVLHRGAYADEAPTIQRLHRYIDDHGYRLRGRHHEIYLTDPRKGQPADNRTIIRQPVDTA